jgi:hypothetical protein
LVAAIAAKVRNTISSAKAVDREEEAVAALIAAYAFAMASATEKKQWALQTCAAAAAARAFGWAAYAQKFFSRFDLQTNQYFNYPRKRSALSH